MNNVTADLTPLIQFDDAQNNIDHPGNANFYMCLRRKVAPDSLLAR